MATAVLHDTARSKGDLTRASEMSQAPSDPNWSYVQGSSEQAENARGKAGATINAKAVTGRAPVAMCNRLHAAYGADAYPNYLLKWDRSRVASYVSDLERELAAARAAAAALDARDARLADYIPRHRYLREPTASKCFCGSAMQAAGSGDPYAWAAREEHPGVFSLPLLSEACCRDVAEEVAHYLAWRAARGLKPFLRERLTLSEVGLGKFEALFLETLGPLIRALYEGPVGAVDSAHSYFAGYGPREAPGANVTRRALIPHTDDSEVTLNVCFGAAFEGGGLKFHGLRTPAATEPMALPARDEFSYRHKLGRAVLHLGAHFHEVEDVTAGERHVLICWFKSWGTYRAQTCPCCRVFRRDVCVCSPSWN